MSDSKLKSLADRIERLMDDHDGIGSDIREVYVEVKSAGYVPKVLRKAITRKRMDANKRDEEDAILDLYEDALGAVGKAVAAVRAGSTWESAAKKHSVPRATLARAVRSQKLQSDTTETADGNPPGESTGTVHGLHPAPALATSCVGPDGCPVPGICERSGRCSLAYAEASRSAPALATPVVCVIPGSPDPCPNTCAPEGRCVWDDTEHADRLRAQIPASTDPAWLEREAERLEFATFPRKATA